MQNLYGNGGFFWWQGVVEDRDDPLLLGRCRVRILGYHNANKVDLPTVDLPWAYPVQAITSAAMNGIGAAPVGPVEGTWVLGFFRDGDECQEPVMLGTVGGVPQIDETLYEIRNPTKTESNAAAVANPDGDVYVNKATGKKVERTATTPPAGVIGPLTEDEIEVLLDTISIQASHSSEETVDANGNIGAYRLSASTLVDLGYLKQGAHAQFKRAGLQDFATVMEARIRPAGAYPTMTAAKKGNFNFFCLATDALWTQRAGSSAINFLENDNAQDNAMEQVLKIHYRYLTRSEIVNSTSSKGEVAGYLVVCHFMGPAGAQDFYKGVVKSLDGVSATFYYNLGYKSVGGVTGLSSLAGAAGQSPEQIPNQSQPVAPPTPPTVASQTSNESLVQTTPNIGFSDPNKVYPKADFIGEPDTSRLARHQKISSTIVGKKDATRRKAVPLALEAGTWDQPLIPYNAKYPFNHVFESEAGHVFELDNTAGNERLHQYHKSGTFVEIDTNGTRVTKIVGDEFVILERNGYVYINGKLNVTIGGTANVKILGDCNLEVDGKLNSLIHSDATIGIAGNLKVAVGGTVDLASKGAMKISTEKTLDISSTEAAKISSAAQVDVKSAKVYIESEGDLNLKSGAKMLVTGASLHLKSTAATTITSGAALNMKATAAVKSSAGAILAVLGASLGLMSPAAAIQEPADAADSATAATPADAGEPGAVKTFTEPAFPELQVPSRSEELAYDLDGLAENPGQNGAALKEIKAKAIEDGTIDEEEFDKEPSENNFDDKQVTARTPVDPGCSAFSGLTEFPTSLKISNYFTLGMLTSGAVVTKVALQELHGLSKAEITCNLHALATQILDPIKERYPNVIITSGFRTPRHSVAVNSQHEFGKAADLQFNGVPKDGYFAIAQWIRDNVPFDQLLLEYKSFGTGNPWIHVSYDTERLRADLRTMWNDRSYPDASTHALVDLSGGA